MKPIIKAYMTVYGVSEDDAWTAYESMSPAQYHDVMMMYNSGYTAQQDAPPAEAEQQPTTTRRHYWILRGNMANSYALRWTDDANGDSAAQVLGMERITRARAMDLARRERELRRYDPSFSGYADAHIHPLDTITIDGILHDISAATSAPGNSIIAERA